MKARLIKVFNKSKINLWLILAVAAGLRFVDLPNAFYGTTGELYRDLTVLFNFTFHHVWPVLGPSSSFGGLNFGAIYYYLLEPFYLLLHFSPSGLVFASAFFSVLSLPVFYLLIQAWFNNKSLSLLGMLLLAVSLYDIQNAYYISNPTPLPFFILVYFYCLTLMLQRRVSWPAVVGAGASFAVAIQLHPTALLVLTAVTLVLLLSRKLAFKIRHYMAAAVVGVILFSPYLLYEALHRFPDLRRYVQLGVHNFGLSVKPESVGSVAAFWDRAILFKNSFFNLAVDRPVVYFLLLPLYFTVPVWFYFWHRRHPAEAKSVYFAPEGKLLIFLWISASSLMFLFFQSAIQHFYFLVLWPAPIILLAWGLWWLKNNYRAMFYYCLAAYITLQIVPLIFFYPYITHREFSYSNITGLFNELRAGSAGGQSFNIINESFDVNLFAYYSRLQSLQGNLTRYRPDYLYLIYASKNDVFSGSAVPGSVYQNVGGFSSHSFWVQKFIKNPS
jgi:4-amino-4-deoxy-L-arabinose transferase-like glycosyltransferase